MQTVRRLINPDEAEIIKSRLEAEGICAVVSGGEAGTMLSHIGTAAVNVRVEVAPEDLQRANEVLEEDERQRASRTAWTCGRCDEYNEPMFDLCWACGKRRADDDLLKSPDDTPVNAPLPDPATFLVDHAGTEVRPSDNPYSPPVSTGGVNAGRMLDGRRPVPSSDSLSQQDQDRLTELVARIFRGAVVGAVIFPPLVALYVISRLMFEVPREAYRDPRLKRKLMLSWAISIVSSLAGTVFWTRFVL